MSSPQHTYQTDSLLAQSRVSNDCDQIRSVNNRAKEETTVTTLPRHEKENQVNKCARSGTSRSPLTPKQPNPWSWLKKRCKSEWTQEILCCLLVLGALAALIAVLNAAEGHPTTVWRDQHYNVSINAVVAVLSALLKGSVMLVVAEGTLAILNMLCSRYQADESSDWPIQMAVV